MELENAKSALQINRLLTAALPLFLHYISPFPPLTSIFSAFFLPLNHHHNLHTGALEFPPPYNHRSGAWSIARRRQKKPPASPQPKLTNNINKGLLKMTTPKAVVPLHEPSYEVQTFDNDNVMCDESHDFSPSLLDDNETGDYANDHDSPLGDHPSWDDVDFDELFGDDVEEDPSTSNRDETNGQGGQPFNENPIPLAVWPPVPPQPYACTCCQVLREIIHTNGVDTAKLEIHGRFGMICHGILEKGGVDRNDQKQEYQMFDFCKENVSNVKQFLVQYCEERKQAGYTMVQDPLSIFYEALCVGLHWDFNFDVDDLFQESPIDLNPQAQNNAMKAKKRPLAEQRQRTKQLTFRDLVGYFHLSEETAAVELQLCASALKNICRREGIRRWPHRRIVSYEKKIEAQKRIVNATADAEGRARALAEIERLNQMIRNIYQLRNQ